MTSVLRGSLCGLALVVAAASTLTVPFTRPVSAQGLQTNSAEPSAQPALPTDGSPAQSLRMPDLPDEVAADFSDIMPLDLHLPVPPEAVAVIDPDAAHATTASLPPAAVEQPSTAMMPEPAYPPAAVQPVLQPAPANSLAQSIGMQLPLLASITRLPESERRAIAEHYQMRALEPIWIDAQGLTPGGKALSATLASASEHGLNAGDYAVSADSTTGSALAELDLRLTANAVLYARDARGARLDPRRLSKLMTPKLDVPAASDVLARLVGSADPAAMLAGYNPPHDGYKTLKAKLQELRGTREPAQPMVRIPAGPALRVGMRDGRVPLIRARLNLGPQNAGEEPVFDRTLSIAVAEFQRGAGLPVNGVAGRATIDAMQGPAASRLEADLIANMERWRWLPADLGSSHVYVNIPQYQVKLVRDGAIALESRVIVGKPETPTAVFSDSMDHLVINPSWFVPPSILKKEFIPGLAADPDYAAKRGFVVTRRGNTITVRQPPGERNALGNIKFMFPNEHAIYLHDTPGRHLFANSRRAFSHGCVRVDQPFKLAAQILAAGTAEEWSEARLRRMIGGGERPIRLSKPLPVHLAYFTQVAEADGSLSTYEDLYGFHRMVRQGLGFGG